MDDVSDDAEITPEEIVDVICARWATAGMAMSAYARGLAVQALYSYLHLADATDGGDG